MNGKKIKNERDEEHVYRLAAANLDACTGEGKHVLLAGTISAEKLHHLYEKLCGYAEQKNYTIQEGGDLAEDAEAIRKLAGSDAVVFAENQLKSVAFCCISTGVFHFPNRRAAEIAVNEVTQWMKEHPGVMDRIIFNVFKDEDRNIYEELLS